MYDQMDRWMEDLFCLLLNLTKHLYLHFSQAVINKTNVTEILLNLWYTFNGIPKMASMLMFHFNKLYIRWLT